MPERAGKYRSSAVQRSVIGVQIAAALLMRLGLEQVSGTVAHADFPTSSTPGRLLWRRFLICIVLEKVSKASQLRRATGVRQIPGRWGETMSGPSISPKNFAAIHGRGRARGCMSTRGLD